MFYQFCLYELINHVITWDPMLVFYINDIYITESLYSKMWSVWSWLHAAISKETSNKLHCAKNSKCIFYVI